MEHEDNPFLPKPEQPIDSDRPIVPYSPHHEYI